MKAVSIVQPWATLIALGEKKFETRSWRTHYRGELAIHASKKPDKSICRYEPFRSVLAKHGYTAENLPVGVILATSRLADCSKVMETVEYTALLESGFVVQGNEFAFGNFSEGRFAWEISDVEPLARPIPAKGRLGLWEYSAE